MVRLMTINSFLDPLFIPQEGLKISFDKCEKAWVTSARVKPVILLIPQGGYYRIYEQKLGMKYRIVFDRLR